jgi:hypothetical protein
MPANHPEESTQHSEQGESLKSGLINFLGSGHPVAIKVQY